MKYDLNSVSDFKLYGFATGSYNCKCLQCGIEFIGDKRSTQCLECAIIQAQDKKPSNNKIKKAVSIIENIVDYNSSEKWGKALRFAVKKLQEELKKQEKVAEVWRKDSGKFSSLEKVASIDNLQTLTLEMKEAAERWNKNKEVL